MLTKTRKKSIFALTTLGVASIGTTIVFGAFNKNTVNVTADTLSMNLFNSYNVEANISTDIEGASSAISFKPISADESTAVVLSKDYVGEFSIGFDYNSSMPSAMLVSFKADDGEAFDVLLQYSEEAYNVCVIKNGEYAGIYYADDGIGIGNTAAYNRNGEYTRIAESDTMKLSFDAATMSVYISNGDATYKVWDFMSDYCDGKRKICPMNAFETYNVEIAFAEYSATPELRINTINGTSIGSGRISSKAKPSVVAYSPYNSYVGKAFVLPEPLVSDLVSDDISVRVSVTDTNGRVILAETAYTDSLSITPSKFVTAYNVKYTATNVFNNSASYTLHIVNYATEDALSMTYDLAYAMPANDTLGVNAVVNIPTTTMSGNLFTTDKAVYALYDVKLGNEVKAENVSADTDTTYTFTETGEYTIVFKAPDAIVSTTTEYTYNVVADKASLECAPMQSSVLAGDTFAIADGYVIVGNDRVQAESKIVFPSGACYANTSIVLSETGVYTIIYEATVNGQSYSFEKTVTAFEGVADMFTAKDGTTFSFGTNNVTDKVSGVKVQTKNAQTVRYNHIIDLNQLTRDDLLLELMADVDVIGSPDFTDFVITLTDIYDSENVLTIKATYSYTNSEGNGTYIKAGAPGQSLQGYYGTPNTTYGYGTIHSFIGLSSHDAVENNTLKLYFDYSTYALYSGPTWGVGIDLKQDYLVADFDDSYFYGTPWGGFTTGEVYLDIEAKGALRRDIGYTIVSIAGNKLDNEYLYSSTVPTLNVNLNGELTCPNGLKGVSYPLFDATAVDVNGNAVNVTKKLYYRYGAKNQVEVEIVDDAFVPTYGGKYTVVYTATDTYQRTATAIYNINVLSESDDMSFTLSETVDDVIAGQSVSLPVVETVSNAFGGVQTEFVVVAPDGTGVEIQNATFLPTQAGKYTMTVRITDYLGRQAEQTKSVSVTVSEQPVVNQTIVVPQYMISGNTYTLPQIVAQDYSTGTVTDIAPQIYVTDATNTDKLLVNGVYTPDLTGSDYTATITYQYVGANGTYTFSDVVEVIYARQSENEKKYDFTKYFDTQATKALSTNAINFTASGSQSVEFIGELSAKTFKINFIAKVNALSSADSISVILTDAQSLYTMVTATLKYNSELQTASISFNGGKEVSLSVELVNNGQDVVFGMYYDQTNMAFYDHLKSFLAYADFEKDQQTVRGFLGDTLRLNLQFNFVGTKQIGVSQINNQIFTSETSYDRITPEIILPTIETFYDYGATVQVLPASAYDVLSSVTSLTVSVKFGNTYVTAVDGTKLQNVAADRIYEFIANEYGQYTIEYCAVDSSSRSNTVVDTTLAIVEDAVAPEITLNGSYKTSFKVGDTVTLIGATVTDNHSTDLTCSIFVVASNGGYTRVTDTYTFTEVGSYVIRYYTIDDNGNIAFMDVKVSVQ